MSKKIVELIIKLEIDTETGATSVISSKPIKESVEDTSTDPIIKLSKSSLILNVAAITLLNVQAGDYLAVTYKSVGGTIIPQIEKPLPGVETGNKLTKKGTISFRGDANKTLAEYGEEFKVVATAATDVFMLTNTSLVESSEKCDEIDIDKEFDFSQSITADATSTELTLDDVLDF